MKPMQVMLYTDADVFAGTERHILDLACALEAEGMGVRIACPTPAVLEEKARAKGLKISPIQKGGLVDVPAVRALCGLLRTGEIDVIHAHNGRAMLSAALAVRMARRGCCVATQHFLEPNHATQRGAKALVSSFAHRWVGGRMAAFIAISEAVRNEMLTRGETPAAKISVVANGIPPPDRAALADPGAIRATLGIPADAPLIVCAARLEAEKNIASLIETMTVVVAALPTAHCLIAGEGSEKNRLHELIQNRHLINKVRLLGFRQDVLSLMNAADVFALPSFAEPFGLVLLESMALGKPVVATAAGGPVEIVADGVTGLLVPPANPAVFANALLCLLMDTRRSRMMGRQGKERYEERFTAARMAAATGKVYRQALERRKGAFALQQ